MAIIDLKNASMRAYLAANAINVRAKEGHCEPNDLQTLCAATMQLAMCCHHLAAQARQQKLTMPNQREPLLNSTSVPDVYRESLKEIFRNSFENEAPPKESPDEQPQG